MARTTFAAVNGVGSSNIKQNQSQTLGIATLVDDNGPATATAVATGTADAVGVAAATGLRLLGYSVRESAGSAAVASLNLRNGGDATGAIIAVEELAADAQKTVWFGPQGIACPLGIFVDRVAGETQIVLYHKTAA